MRGAVASAAAALLATAGAVPALGALSTAGPERVVFDWSRDACGPEHYADLPVRAFRDARGRVQLVLPHLESTRMIGPDLDHLAVDCAPVLDSARDPRPSRYDDRSWLAATWTRDGRTIRGLVHQEYQGWQHPGRCPRGVVFGCWQNAITAVVSRDGGATFTARRPPGQLVAAGPYRYRAGTGPAGVFAPSNIVRNTDDRRLYALVQVEARGAQPWGVCVMRTARIGDPRAWRAWDGEAFRVRFLNPYTNPRARASVCRPVSRDALQKVHDGLIWNRYLRRWVVVGVAHSGRGRGPRVRSGIYYSTSEDLIHWERRRLLVRAELPWTHRCRDRDPILYPSLIDPRSPSRNFDVSGRRALLFYTRLHYRGCRMTPDRDLVRRAVVVSRP